MKNRLLAIALLFIASAQAAVYTSSDFANEELEARYWELAEELRCLVCQNQSLADSNAELAGDLRRVLFEQLHKGKSNAQIRTFLVERYGNYVLYDPPLDASTFLLWAGPVVILLLACLLLWLALRRYSRGSP